MEVYALLEELSGCNLRTYRYIFNIPPAQTPGHHRRNLEFCHHLAQGFKKFVYETWFRLQTTLETMNTILRLKVKL